MAYSYRAPKQWVLKSDASVTDYESWKNNIIFTLNENPVNHPFLAIGATWLKQSRANPKRGFTNDGNDVAENIRKTADQKVYALEMMLGQIANYQPINRATIVKNSTSLNSIWKALRQHLGFQANGARMLNLADLSLDPGERHEDLYQRMLAFMDDNLMKADGDLTHLGEEIAEDEEASPSLENVMVVLWLKLIHKDLPKLVKQRYGAELRSRSIASIKDEISAALDSLIDEIHTNQDAKALRSVINSNNRSKFGNTGRSSKPAYRSNKECALCVSAKRENIDHFLTECRYLPEKDKSYIKNLKARTSRVDDDDVEEDQEQDDQSDGACARSVVVPAVARRVPVVSSPYIDTYYKHHMIRVTIDSGATGNFIRLDVAKRIKANIRKNTQQSHQADGTSNLKIVGEVTLTLTFKEHSLLLEALVAADLDDEVLGGTPFMEHNDVWVRPKNKVIGISDDMYEYKTEKSELSSKRIVAQVLRAPKSLTVWPGDFIEVEVPEVYAGEEVALEPRTDTPLNSKYSSHIWPSPQLATCSHNSLRIPNLSKEPKTLQKGEHFCQIRSIKLSDSSISPASEDKMVKHLVIDNPVAFKDISIDPQNITPSQYKCKFENLCESFGHVFNPKFSGYNGRDGCVKAVVNMGPVLPPQRKGRMPMYNRNNLELLQSMFDELEELGVFAKPENVGVNVEYVNPSFLVKKPRGGHRLVTDFGTVAQYAKPQPSLMPDMDSVLRTIGQWKYIIQTDLCKAYFQIPLDPSSMKYCGVVTPFKGVRVYTKSAMGMPGSESALEEVMSRVLGNMVQAGQVVKLADNLYCGANSLAELYDIWENLLRSLSRNNIHLSPSQTVINPKSTNILGWVWSQGTLSANPHAVCTLQTCTRPETVTQLRSYVGAYKVLSRVLKDCSHIIGPLDKLTAGRSSSEKLRWDNQSVEAFNNAQQYVSKVATITLPRQSDKLWIVMDAATRKPGVGATLYIDREDCDLMIGGFFSAKLSSNQIDWLPCEREALAIGSSVKYFQPFITQSNKQTSCLSDSKPCVQAFSKMQRGEFSASPRVSTFLSICHRFQVAVQHIAGVKIPLSDFQSRNPNDCNDSSCQVCRFIAELEESVVRAISVKDILEGKHKIPFLSRTAWQSTQLECPDLRRAHAHLRQGTRPSKKHTNIRDVKRYLNNITIARDGLLVVRNDEPMAPVKERIVVPRSVLHGLLSSLHIKLDHPTHHQLKLVAQRYFYALDMESAIEQVSSSCHLCASLSSFEHCRQPQSTSDPPDGVCIQFACDVIRRERQFILVLRDVVTSYTWSLIISNEQANSLREGILKLCIPIRPTDGPSSVIRVDPAPGFVSLKDNEELKSFGITLDIGRVKNINKNPVAERAVQELEAEILKHDPSGGPISDLKLSIATARLNTRIRGRGLSSREMLFQRDQLTNDQIPVSDRDLILKQHTSKLVNHPYSEKSKAPLKDRRPDANINVGDLVYLHSDRDKTRARDRYLVVSTDIDWVYIRKFTGKQLRNASYKVKRSECFKVPSTLLIPDIPNVSVNEEDHDISVPIRHDEMLEPSTHPPASEESSQPFEQHNPDDALLEEVKPSIQELDSNMPDSSHSTRSQRNRKPPDRLSLKWDNSQSYDQ